MSEFDWNKNKKIRELTTSIQLYEIHALREIENNKVCAENKICYSSQKYLEILYERYEALTNKKY